MKEIIESIFLSNTCGMEEFKTPQSEEYSRLDEKEYKLYEKMKEALSPELFKTFNDFFDTAMDKQSLIDRQYYAAGFKTGLKLATEAFDFSDIFKS